MPDPALCTETLETTIKTGTFRLFLQESGGVEFEVGDDPRRGLHVHPAND